VVKVGVHVAYAHQDCYRRRQPVIRHCLRLFIQSSTDWQICGEAENGESAVALVERSHPDLLILDLSMPIMNGLDAARKMLLISPRIVIVLFTAYASEPLLTEARSIGIKAVVPKDGNTSVDDLIAALREMPRAA
jgi:two-component system, NarL family, response regulator